MSLALLLVSCQVSPAPQKIAFKVEQVIDGQQLDISFPGAMGETVQRIQLLGVEAPDLEQFPWGPQAKQRLEELLAVQPTTLRLENDSPDREPPRLAYIWQGKTLVNRQLVEEGLALTLLSPDLKYSQQLAYAQEKARLLGVGIWDPQRPMRQTPGEFRANR